LRTMGITGAALVAGACVPGEETLLPSESPYIPTELPTETATPSLSLTPRPTQTETPTSTATPNPGEVVGNWGYGYSVEKQGSVWVVRSSMGEIGQIRQEGDEFLVRFNADTIRSYVEYDQVPEWNVEEVQLDQQTGNLLLTKYVEKKNKSYRMFSFSPQSKEMEQILYEYQSQIVFKDKGSGRELYGIEYGDTFFNEDQYHVYGFVIEEPLMIQEGPEWYNSYMRIPVGIAFDGKDSGVAVPLEIKYYHWSVGLHYIPYGIYEWLEPYKYPILENPEYSYPAVDNYYKEHLKPGLPIHFVIGINNDPEGFLQRRENLVTIMSRNPCYDIQSCIPFVEQMYAKMGSTEEMKDEIQRAYEKGEYPRIKLFNTAPQFQFGISGSTP
jgi:hypothetical protein